jgi:hypothetical protein
MLPPVAKLPAVPTALDAEGTKLPVLNIQADLPCLKCHSRDLHIVSI